MRRRLAEHSDPETNNEHHGDNQKADMIIYKLNYLGKKSNKSLTIWTVMYLVSVAFALPDREIFQQNDNKTYYIEK